ncbi:MAG TPA: DegT/DnrJ/EryC1/StrS family aminotransferase [Polyangiaceae bacterium]|jgi:perosamine synthetase|nr:DegT/DnrJ/EryC1/StrS family aminotransferase [Polyangiaceae bacterium]
MSSDFIPVCEPNLGGRELEYVTKAVSGGWISSSGSYVGEFEREFAKYLGVPYAVTTTSGTTALHLALVAAGIGPGDEVIIPAFTMIASAFAVCYTGAKPVFVDSDVTNWNIDPSLVAAKVTKKTKAIMPVHVYGHACDMDELQKIADAHGLLVIEDAAEAIGSFYKGRKCGAIGDINCFSLFANKLITTGEGGMVVARDDRFIERLRYYKNLCFPLDGSRRYVHDEIGFNYRMPNVLAAIGLAQLERADFYLECRRSNAVRYNALLKGQKGIGIPPEAPWTSSSYWMYSILIGDDFGMSRDEVMTRLKAAGIETRSFFVSMHRQPALAKYGCDVSGQYPVTDELARTGLYLPSTSGLTDAQIARIVKELLALRAQ